jgi:catechol 2,3-dioxygenase-like lactoylglutathione lyase family enzyme
MTPNTAARAFDDRHFVCETGRLCDATHERISMITGAHILLYSNNPQADRAFFRDILGFPYVDDGGGWLIFALPPSEAGIHPTDEHNRLVHGGHRMVGAVFYLMCSDLRTCLTELEDKKVRCTEVEVEEWGIRTTIRLPSGGEIGLYQPTHKTALGLASD